MRGELAPPPYPKVPLWRRGAALAIDFAAVGLLSLTLGGSVAAQAVVFLLAWLGLRVLLVTRNLGQSLGRWALDMKVVDARIGGTPGLQALLKREGLLGVATLCLLLGLVNLSPAKPWSLLLFLPLGLDCSLAAFDRVQRQAFHDQISRTLVVQTRRGYSLDIKIKRWVAYAQRRMK